MLRTQDDPVNSNTSDAPALITATRTTTTTTTVAIGRHRKTGPTVLLLFSMALLALVALLR